MTNFDEKTRITQVTRPAVDESGALRTDCLVVIYTKEPTLLGKRFVLESSPLRIGRGTDNHIVLDSDSVSRRHASFTLADGAWKVADEGSTNGTYSNDVQVTNGAIVRNGDRIKIGATIFKFLSGADVESQYHEEIYRLTIVDGLTQIHNKRYLHEALERELIRARRHGRSLAVMMFDLDHFKRVNDTHGHLAGDFVLKEVAGLVQGRIRRDEVFARYGGEEFCIVLPESLLDGAAELGERLREEIEGHTFVFQTDRIVVTVSVGCAVLADEDRNAAELLKRADERLYQAKNSGRNRVCA
ncbi:MAG: GGDEF domain-containing protein [Myxococcales bacterium]|nr:GGDEF domain-containing protein [Myxococcales bacterium]